MAKVLSKPGFEKPRFVTGRCVTGSSKVLESAPILVSSSFGLPPYRMGFFSKQILQRTLAIVIS